MPPRQLRSGFSLIELIVTIVFLAIVASYALVFGARSVGISEFGRARDTALAELTLARSQALGGSSASAWGVRFATSSLTTFKGSSYASRDTAYDLTTAFAPDVIFSGATSVVFLPPDGSAQAGTVFVTNGKTSSTLSINAIGGISMQ